MKTKFILLFNLLILSYCSSAQTDSLNKYIPPKYVSGIKELRSYACKYISYPQFAKEQEISGVVDATIYIDKTGKVKLVRTQGTIPEFNSEALPYGIIRFRQIVPL